MTSLDQMFSLDDVTFVPKSDPCGPPMEGGRKLEDIDMEAIVRLSVLEKVPFEEYEIQSLTEDTKSFQHCYVRHATPIMFAKSSDPMWGCVQDLMPEKEENTGLCYPISPSSKQDVVTLGTTPPTSLSADFFGPTINFSFGPINDAFNSEVDSDEEIDVVSITNPTQSLPVSMANPVSGERLPCLETKGYQVRHSKGKKSKPIRDHSNSLPTPSLTNLLHAIQTVELSQDHCYSMTGSQGYTPIAPQNASTVRSNIFPTPKASHEQPVEQIRLAKSYDSWYPGVNNNNIDEMPKSIFNPEKNLKFRIKKLSNDPPKPKMIPHHNSIRSSDQVNVRGKKPVIVNKSKLISVSSFKDHKRPIPAAIIRKRQLCSKKSSNVHQSSGKSLRSGTNKLSIFEIDNSNFHSYWTVGSHSTTTLSNSCAKFSSNSFTKFSSNSCTKFSSNSPLTLSNSSGDYCDSTQSFLNYPTPHSKRHEPLPRKIRDFHNMIERKRREELRNQFIYLKSLVPELRTKQKSSKLAILTHASDYCLKLSNTETFLNQEIAKQNSIKTNFITKLESLIKKE